MNRIQHNKIKSLGDIPNARFGHTLTMVSKSKAVLFGGAIAENGKFIITNQTYLYDFITNKWKKLNFQNGTIPSQRAAHASVMISDLQMAVYGGAASGTQGLLKDDLYILDLRKQPIWRTIQMINKHNTPGQRYGHTMVYSKPFLIVFGGNTGNKAQNDVWLFNTQKAPFMWIKYEFQSKIMPCPRVYHSAALCQQGAASGMIVIFGGRRQTKKQNNSLNKQANLAALNDVWGLRKHRDGSWDWVSPPKNQSYIPLSRYQHIITFFGTMMIIIGGRTNMPQQATSLMQVYNTQTSQWYQLEAVSRYRHAIITSQNNLYIHGGFQPQYVNQPLQTMICLDLSIISKLKNTLNTNNEPENQNIQKNQKIDRKAEKNTINLANTNVNVRPLRQMKQSQRNASNNSRIKIIQKNKQRDLTPSRMLTSAKNIRLSNQAIVATYQNNNMQIQKVHVNTLLQQSKRLTQQPLSNESPLFEQQLIDSFLPILLPINGLSKSLHTTLFAFKKEKIIKLCEQVCKILLEYPSLIYLRAPVKIFGSLYGRYYDLLRLFQNFGNPDDHQLQTFDYIFLGNYVDKGYNSLELICLLFALKLKHPEHIIMLRGSHEDSKVNRLFGLAQQCAVRLGQNIQDQNSVYQNINKVFELLPLAVVIDQKILCVHSGIGNIKTLNQIQMIERPVNVSRDKKVIDLLWSNSSENTKDVMNYNPSKMNQYTLNSFLEQNSLSMIIRSKQCIQQGYLYQGNKLNLFSVSNYGKSGNNAAIFKITKNLQFTPYVLQPSSNIRGAWINDNILKTNINFTQQEQQLRKKMFSIGKKK